MEDVLDCRMQLYRAGLSDVEMAKVLSMSKSGIQHWRAKYGLKTNRQAKYHKPTLCWTCQNTNREKCSWFDPDNPRPVEGWAAMQTVKRGGAYPFSSYFVISCPNYKPEREDKGYEEEE